MPGKEPMYYKMSLNVFVVFTTALILLGLIMVNVNKVWIILIYISISIAFLIVWVLLIRSNLANSVKNIRELTKEKIERCIPTLCSEIMSKIRKGKPADGQIAYLADFLAIALGNPNISVDYLQELIRLHTDKESSFKYKEVHYVEGCASIVILDIDIYTKKVATNETLLTN